MLLLRGAQKLNGGSPLLTMLATRLQDAGPRGFASSSAAGSATTSAKPQEEASFSGPPKLVVFGGRGFVGSAVCKEALKTGLHVLSISPSGTPPTGAEPWTKEVQWVRGNALEPMTYQHLLPGAIAAISCVGGFGTQAEMLRINGTANVTAVTAAAAAGVPRYVYVSAQIPPLPGLEYALDGYIRGKKQAEDAVLTEYPSTGVVLRPGLIYGDRAISTHVTLPLGLLVKPVEAMLGYMPLPTRKQLAQLPVIGAPLLKSDSVEAVARAAVAGATDDSVPGGIIDCWQIAERYEQ